MKQRGRDGESNKAFPLTPPSPSGRGRMCERFVNIRRRLASIPRIEARRQGGPTNTCTTQRPGALSPSKPAEWSSLSLGERVGVRGKGFPDCLRLSFLPLATLKRRWLSSRPEHFRKKSSRPGLPGLARCPSAGTRHDKRPATNCGVASSLLRATWPSPARSATSICRRTAPRFVDRRILSNTNRGRSWRATLHLPNRNPETGRTKDCARPGQPPTRTVFRSWA